MALQVGELFARFTVDVSGAEAALEQMERRARQLREDLLAPQLAALGEQAAEALAQTLDAETGDGITETLLAGMTAGVHAGGPALRNALDGLARDCLREAGAALSAGAGRRIGTQFGQGMGQGIAGARSAVSSAAARLGNEAASALRQALAVRSPSRVTREIGAYFDAGMLAGIRGGEHDVGTAAREMGRQAAEALASAVPRRQRSAAEQTEMRTERGQTDPLALARMLASALDGVSVRLDGSEVGRMIAPAVSQAIAQSARARRDGTE